jgi:hypothetical protein
MKSYLLISVAILISTMVYSQSQVVHMPTQRIKHGPVGVPDNGIQIFCSSGSFFSTVQIIAARDSGTQNEIQFLFITTPRNTAGMKFDSITLEASAGKTLLIDRPIYDSVYSQSDGGMDLFSIHLLDLQGVKFVKSEKIKRMTMLVNHTAVSISISNKSQRALNKLANESW